MTSSLSDRRRERAVVLTADEAGAVSGLSTPELRNGQWTRLGDVSVLGDRVTESVLGGVADRVRAAATAEGYAVGWAQGTRDAGAAADEAMRLQAIDHTAAEARRDAEHRAAVAALGQAADEVRSQLRRLTEAVEEQATALAWAITEEILGREVASAGGPDVVRRVLDVLPVSALARVRLHPDVARAPEVRELVDRGLDVVADPTLEPPDALVEWDGAVVDLRIGEAMARVHAVLFAPKDERP